MISKRLKQVADYINKKDIVVDIGCDHALLDIYLVKEKKLKNIIVSDILQSALDNAIKNIKKYKLEDKITPILSDGLENINISKIDTIIISGMGTKNIIKILRNIGKSKNIKKIVIQSNNDYYYLRTFMKREGFIIKDESVIKDKNINYITMQFIRGKKMYFYSDYMFGPVLKLDKNNLWYFQENLKSLEFINKNIPYTSMQKKYALKKIRVLSKIIKKLNNF